MNSRTEVAGQNTIGGHRVTLRQLDVILAIAEHDTLEAAAVVVGVGWRGIEVLMRNLSERNGWPLLLTGSRPSSQLSDVGRVVADAALDIVTIVDEIGFAIEDHRQQEQE